MTEEITLTLNSPITDEQWDTITDVDFEHTDRIWFHTKHGQEVEFVKRKNGRWIHDGYDIPRFERLQTDARPSGVDWMHCSVCGRREPHVPAAMTNFCPSCGAKMESTEVEE